MSGELIPQLIAKKTAIAVVGLGYTGLPLALALAEHFWVIGYDNDTTKVEALERGEGLPENFSTQAFQNNLEFIKDPSLLTKASFYIVAVPTPVDDQKNPDLEMLATAMCTVGKVLQKGNGVVLESTVYPGCTEEFCVPLLEETSSLRLSQDFWVGYSPERINPGDTQHHVRNVIKLIAGTSAEALEALHFVYSNIVAAGLHPCASIKVAEAAKMTENIQRDVNISLLNELSAVYEKLGIDPSQVWEAAATKWNFAPFRPGLAGGHCISIDPYYLLYRARMAQIEPQLVAMARLVNEQIVDRVAQKVVSHLSEVGISLREARVLVKGVSFKGNVGDIRNSKILEVVKLLKEQGVQVDLEDPLVNNSHLKKEVGWELSSQLLNNYEVVIVAADHSVYNNLGEDYFCGISGPQALIMDLKGMFQGKVTQRKYWSL
jgi:UDP-N-acetyl-D-glucosamine/UDP-N-acetyl-D-galactosamine dehydrogenase